MLTSAMPAGMIVGVRGQHIVLLQLRRQPGSKDQYEWRFSAVPGRPQRPVETRGDPR